MTLEMAAMLRASHRIPLPEGASDVRPSKAPGTARSGTMELLLGEWRYLPTAHQLTEVFSRSDVRESLSNTHPS
jgi:hypothetical protein